MGNQYVPYKSGGNLVLTSLRNYLILIGVVGYGFGILSQIEAKKEKDLGVYSALDGLINNIFYFISVICFIVGVFGIVGYLV
ncbi:hypothetical protein [Sulfurimonas sp. NWX79]|uniref:hypothetical protein n=1 Tax=Sulfurimonas sp. NWX79 TaxID=2925412 RepID=UPI003204F061